MIERYLADAGEYNVYTVATSRSVRTLTGGLDVVPHLSFEELAARLHGDPDIVVVPLSWRTGAEVLAESGVIDGKEVTAHWGDIDRLERTYPKVHWQRGIRYIDGGMLLSTAGLRAGVEPVVRIRPRPPDGWPGPRRRGRTAGRRGIMSECRKGFTWKQRNSTRLASTPTLWTRTRSKCCEQRRMCLLG